MENRAKFECGIWLRNGNVMVVNLLQMEQRNKRLNTSSSASKICKENGQMGCKWNWKLQSERSEYFKSPLFWSYWVESQIEEQWQTLISRARRKFDGEGGLSSGNDALGCFSLWCQKGIYGARPHHTTTPHHTPPLTDNQKEHHLSNGWGRFSLEIWMVYLFFLFIYLHHQQ